MTEIDEQEVYRTEIEAMVEQEKTQYPSKPEKNPPIITPALIEQLIREKHHGLGILYRILQDGKIVKDCSTDEFLIWTGHHWDRDIRKAHLAAVEDVVDLLISHVEKMSAWITTAIQKRDDAKRTQLEYTRAAIIKQIKFLRTVNGRKAAVEFATTIRDPLSIRGDELDQEPMMLGCQNGVLDLRTGECRPGKPEQFISKASPVEWRGVNTPAPKFEAWLTEVLSDDPDSVAFLQRALGYAITGLTQEHVLLVLHGGGRNGKGTLIEVLKYVLGPLAGPIQAEMLLDQGRARSSAGPSPDIMSLRGLRVAFASETDEDRKFSPSRVKWLTGGDTLVGRHPFDKYDVSFRPTHTLFLLTNHKPSAPDTDFAFWERVRLVPFKLAFVDREPSAVNERRARKGVVDELKDEAPGILAWLVRGCLAYQNRGLDPPLAVKEATADWQKAENEILDFIEDYCKRDDFAKISASLLYDNFNRWFIQNRSRKGITQSKFGRIMGKRFEKKKEGGGIYYLGLEMSREVPESDPENEQL